MCKVQHKAFRHPLDRNVPAFAIARPAFTIAWAARSSPLPVAYLKLWPTCAQKSTAKPHAITTHTTDDSLRLTFQSVINPNNHASMQTTIKPTSRTSTGDMRKNQQTTMQATNADATFSFVVGRNPRYLSKLKKLLPMANAPRSPLLAATTSLMVPMCFAWSNSSSLVYAFGNRVQHREEVSVPPVGQFMSAGHPTAGVDES